ncbi:hypothetical protein, partial [Klebsiella michiganensis]
PQGLQAIARRVHAQAARLAAALTGAGLSIAGSHFFDTVTVTVPGKAASIAAEAESGGRLLRIVDQDRLGITVDETTSEDDLKA